MPQASGTRMGDASLGKLCRWLVKGCGAGELVADLSSSRQLPRAIQSLEVRVYNCVRMCGINIHTCRFFLGAWLICCETCRALRRYWVLTWHTLCFMAIARPLRSPYRPHCPGHGGACRAARRFYYDICHATGACWRFRSNRESRQRWGRLCRTSCLERPTRLSLHALLPVDRCVPLCAKCAARRAAAPSYEHPTTFRTYIHTHTCMWRGHCVGW